MMTSKRLKQISAFTLMDIVIGIGAIFVVPYIVMCLWNGYIPGIVNIDTLPTLPYWHVWCYLFFIWVFLGTTEISPVADDKEPSLPKIIIYCLAYVALTIVEFILLGKIYNNLFVCDFSNIVSLPYLSGGQLFIVWLFIKLVFKKIKITFLTKNVLKELEEEKTRQENSSYEQLLNIFNKVENEDKE